ncbi:MAG TPA: GYD domain-containing protein [Hyphomicrobium sp.]
MPTFIVIANFTDKGVHDAKDTVNRADKFKAIAKSAGVTIKDMYWTIGAFDVVTICEAPDDETATALSLSIAARGYVRTQTLRAFTPTEISKVLGKMV